LNRMIELKSYLQTIYVGLTAGHSVLLFAPGNEFKKMVMASPLQIICKIRIWELAFTFSGTSKIFPKPIVFAFVSFILEGLRPRYTAPKNFEAAAIRILRISSMK